MTLGPLTSKRTPAAICQMPDTRQIGVMVRQHQMPNRMATVRKKWISLSLIPQWLLAYCKIYWGRLSTVELGFIS